MTAIRSSLNYLSPSTPNSLRRSGRHLMRRNVDGSDSALEGVEIEREMVSIAEGRSEGCHLDEHGFELVTAPLEDDTLDFLSMAPVIERYYAECEALVQSSTGASLVRAFDHNVRSATAKSEGKRIEGGQEVQGPARIVHGDYTLTSAPQRLRDLARPPSANDTYGPLLGSATTLLDAKRVEEATLDGRFAFINVWRNIDSEPVQSDPMALCDARSVTPEDLVVFEIHYGDRIGENYWSKSSPAHRWFSFSQMERNEALLIKQWDSAGPLARTEGRLGDDADTTAPCSFSFHTAFFDKATMEGKRPRMSIEVRCVAFWE